MINVSNDFKTKTKKIKQQNIKLGIVDGELTVKDIHFMTVKEFNALPVWMLRKRKEVIAKELKYSFEGKLFKTIMKQIEITVKNAGELKDKNVNFQYGIYVNNDFEYIDLGDFYIKDIEDDKGKKELVVTGYDKMINFMKTFKQSELQLTYPCPMLALVQKMCEICGVELYSTDFFNADLQVDEDYFTAQELSYRDVLEKVAESTETTIFIKDNKLYLHKLASSPVEKLDASYLTELTVKEKFGPVNALVLGRGDVEDNVEAKDDTSIAENGRCEIRFDENEFVEYQREQVIDEMFEQIKGLEYYAFEGSDVGVMWLEPCDLIELEDTEGSIYKSIYLIANITINTGISSDIEADIPEETNTEYKVTTKEEKKTLKVERLAKKNEGLIQDLVQETTANTEKLSKHEQTLDSITDTLSSVETTVETVDNKVDTAQSTADTANQNAQNAQKTANDAVTQITTTTQKVTEIEQTVDGITQSVSNVEEKIETVETKADNAQKSANTANTNATNAQNTANSINDNLTTNYYTKTETNSEINQKADEISSTVSKTYSTKTETTQAKQDAINSANASTDEKLEDYSTTEEMNSAITQKADSITSEVSKTYSTKTETTNAKNAAINSANSSTDNKLKNYSTTTQMNSAITQSANAINTTVSKKVGKNEVISSINQSSESIKINADKIELTANDVLNLLAGNTINLSGKEITMTSDHLNIDSNGKITITDEGTSTSYYFEIKKINSNNNLKIGSYEISITNSLANSFIRAGEIGTSDNSGNQIYFNPNTMQFITASNITTLKASGIETPHITVNDGGNKNVTIEGNGYLGCDSLYVDATGINCVGNIQAHSHIYCNNGVEPFSLAEKKRDIEKYNNKALDEVLNTDIYYYNYKEDAENIKRRVGAIIGDKYKCSKEIIGTEGKGIDLYSMISVAYKAVQEQQEIIEKQNKTIEELTARVEKLEKAGEA